MNKGEPPSNKSNKRNWRDKLSQLLLREPHDREELFEVLHEAEQRDLLDADALEMIKGVLDVADQQARDIMVPPSKMVVLEIDSQLDDILSIIIQSGHSRFPVVGETRDEILGILHAKDLLRPYSTDKFADFDLSSLLRQAFFVPESKHLDVLLKEFRLQHKHLAIVVDEYGGVAGLITIEDVLERIVGDISDEHDPADNIYIHQQENNHYTVNALTPITEFNEHFDTDLSNEEYTTIGGLVLQGFGHFPKVGESIVLENFEFKVLHADKRRIDQLLVVPPIEDSSEEGE